MVSAARAAAEECGHGTTARHHVEVLERTALRLLASAQQVLYAAIAEERGSDEPFDPHAVARAWIEDSAHLGQRITASFSGDAAWLSHRGNAGQFVALLQSMLSNALDHGARDEPIEVGLESTSASLSVTISNAHGARAHRGLGVGGDVCRRLAGLLGARFEAQGGASRFVARVVLFGGECAGGRTELALQTAALP
jgi:signal transduction histidine kinase